MDERMHCHAYHSMTKGIMTTKMSLYYLISYSSVYCEQMMKKNRMKHAYSDGSIHTTSAKKEVYGEKMDDV